MNLGDVRAAIFAQADWAPTQSPDAVARVNAFINRAYNQLALEAPFLFFESEVKFATQPDFMGGDEDDQKIVVVTDTDPVSSRGPRNAWVMELNAEITAENRGDYSQWPLNREWDGRVIEIVDSNGVAHRNRIRTVWLDTVNQDPLTFKYRMSLWKPWPIYEYGTGPFVYRVYNELYYLPDDIIQFKSARLWKASYNWPLTVLGQDEAEQRSLGDRRTEIAAGQPRALFRRGHFQLPGPSVAPDAKVGENLQLDPKWEGPEPPGEFEYRITYTWGVRDIDHGNKTVGAWDHNPGRWTTDITGDAADPSRARFREPLWESSPSPTSNAVTVTPPPDNGVPSLAVELTLPNIEYMQGFMLKLSDQSSSPYRLNYARSGWHVRIYRRRKSANFDRYSWLATAGGRYSPHLHKMDISNKFHLIAEVRIDDVNDGKWIDNGTYLPDYHRPLRHVHGYQTVQMYPKPDDRYEVDVRCVRRPAELVDDTDAPRVHPEAIDVLIHSALSLLYEHQGNLNMANWARGRYEDNLATLRKRYAEQRPPQTPIQRRYGRARRGLSGRGIRRWWNTDSS